MAQEIRTDNSIESGKVMPKDNVTVYGTEKANMGTGKAYQVHRSAAEKLVKNGMATYENPNDKQSKKA